MASQTRVCIRCGGEIPAERVEALPETRLCIKCSQDVGSDFVTIMKQENLGKAGSLKKNYGDVTVRRRRNEEGLRRLQEDYEREQWERKKQGP